MMYQRHRALRLAGPFTAVATLLLFAAAGPRVKAVELGDASQGRAHAEQFCARCHAVAPDDRFSPVADATPFKDVAATPGMTGTALTVWMRSEHPSMPNIVLKYDELHDMIAYILSLRERN